MTKSSRATAPILLVGLLVGCGGTPATSTSRPAPPHGGRLVPLPENKGFVEVVLTSKGRARTADPEFTFYFLGPEVTAPLSPTPSSGTLTVNTPKGPATVTLQPKGEALASPPGPTVLDGHDLEGELSIDLGGQAIKIALTGR